MPISDTNVERRNLVVSSLCFILFYIGDGQIDNNEIRLQIINVKFLQPCVLAYFAWGMLGWFLLRYWQINKGQIKNYWHKEIKPMSNSAISIWYLKKRIQKPYREPDGFFPSDILTTSQGLKIQVADVVGGHRHENGNWINFSAGNTRNVNVDGFYGGIFKVYSFVVLAIKKPGFGSYIIPYILCYFAFFLGLVNLKL